MFLYSTVDIYLLLNNNKCVTRRKNLIPFVIAASDILHAVQKGIYIIGYTPVFNQSAEDINHTKVTQFIFPLVAFIIFCVRRRREKDQRLPIPLHLWTELIGSSRGPSVTLIARFLCCPPAVYIVAAQAVLLLLYFTISKQCSICRELKEFNPLSGASQPPS